MFVQEFVYLFMNLFPQATEKQMHQLAVDPPKLLDRYDRRVQYLNKNGMFYSSDKSEKLEEAFILYYANNLINFA